MLPLLWNLVRSPWAAEPTPPAVSAVAPVPVQHEAGILDIVVQGSAYAMGWQQGNACREPIQALIDGFYEQFAVGRARWLYHRFLPPRLYALWRSVPRVYQDELWGVAHGAAVPLKDVLLINFFDDILNLLELGYASACSCVVMRDRSGQIMVGRNLDYTSAVGQLIRQFQVRLVRQPESGQASVSLGVVGQVGVLTAMNTAGLSLGSLTAQSRDRTWRGVGVSLLYRLMLDQCLSVSEAIAVLDRYTPAQGNNLMLADATRGARLEFSSRRRAVTWLEDQPLSITNHYLDPQLFARRTQLYQRKVASGSNLRQTRLCSLLPSLRDRDDLIAAMTDGVWPTDTPPTTRTPWQTGGVISNWGTLHTAILTPSTRRWDWAIGWGEQPIQASDFRISYPLGVTV